MKNSVKISLKVSSKFHDFWNNGLKRIDMVVIVMVIGLITVINFAIQ